MIKKISISGYRSIKELKDFELKPLNVLIGPNKGGKTNFLDFFGFLGDAVRGKLTDAIKYRGGFPSIVWGGDRKTGIHCEIIQPVVDDDVIIPYRLGERRDISYKLSITQPWPGGSRFNIEEMVNDQVIRPEKLTSKEMARDFDYNNLVISEPWQAGLPGSPKTRSLKFAFSRMRLYRRFNVILSAPMRHSALLVSGSPQDNFELNSEGDNLSIVYYHLFNTHKFRAIKDDILGILNNVFPDFTDIKFPADLGQGLVLLGWCEKTFEPMFYPQQLSEGTLQLLCLLAVLYNPYPPSIVCIDEPEIGLHPEMIKIVAELLIQASERMQIIVATHSPTLVSALSSRPEDIVVVEAENGASQFKRLDEKDWVEWLKDFTLGELWETGHIGGRL